jgi:hypothetical protein
MMSIAPSAAGRNGATSIGGGDVDDDDCLPR